MTEWVPEVQRLEREKRLAEAETLLRNLIDATERESLATGHGVAPWYYERLAILYQKTKRTGEAIRVLERFAGQRHAPGAKPAQLLSRLAKLRE